MPNAPLSTATRFYLRILILLFALAGVLSLAGLQTGLLVAAGKIQPAALQEEQQEDAADIFAATGPVEAWSAIMPIDTALDYDISAEIRAIGTQEDQFEQTRIYLGVETLDANMKPLRSGPGSYRYGGAVDYHLAPVQGWITLEGTMSGEGDERHDQFRPGTRFVRVVALLNYQSDGRRAEIRNVRFAPRIELAKR